MSTTTTTTTSPAAIAARRTAALARYEAGRRADARAHGYRGPLTRAELAEQAARNAG